MMTNMSTASSVAWRTPGPHFEATSAAPSLPVQAQGAVATCAGAVRIAAELGVSLTTDTGNAETLNGY
jgi:hypothetical protein